MSDDALPDFDESQLSEDDLAVLRAFEAMEDWNTDASAASTPASAIWSAPSSPDEQSGDDFDEMLLLFASEADEDITRMRDALKQLDFVDHIDPARFVTLRRAAHKLRGTAGTVEFHAMATIAQRIEETVDQITAGTIFPLVGVNVLVQAVFALEMTLKSVVEQGKESGEPLAKLEADLKDLASGDEQASAPAGAQADHSETAATVDEATAVDGSASLPAEQESLMPVSSRAPDAALPTASSTPFVYIDARRLEQLVHHSEHLTEQRTPLESAQAQVEVALQELQAAQGRLLQLGPMLSTLLPTTIPAYLVNEHPTSSLIARILNNAAQQNDASSARKGRVRSRVIDAAGSLLWDELDIERYTEKDLLIRSLNEAIADVTTASTHVRTAFAHFNLILQSYMNRASMVRSDTLLLRLAPLSALMPRLQRAITMSALAQERLVQFEVTGDGIEIDQDILETLAGPLLQLVRTCLADTFSAAQAEDKQEPYRIWLHAQSIGNEIALEIGFSMTVHGGALDEIREPVQRLNGTISSQRNAAGGISFHLQMPRSNGAAHCLLVRAGNERVIVPFSQVQRVGDGNLERCDILYHLSDLLGFSRERTPVPRIQPTLILAPGVSRLKVGVAVDEIVDEVELVVKQLADHLQRPGITGAAVDGRGKVLLMLDLPELIRHYTHHQPAPGTSASDEQVGARPPRVLVADDSVYLRHSLLQMLKHEDYTVMEARDGMEALEQLLECTPDVFLLDVEMPNLNGYDLLSIMRLYPEMAGVKIVMLTSRSSEKHVQRALDMGAHVYLTKPCSHETLLNTIRELLK
jgi:chemosensory pili system protein ChpA (sensor histidine kinase/response regulator)